MFRRDFLKAIAAVGAAMVAPAIAKPRGNSGGLAALPSPRDINAELRALLKQSKCISIDRTMSVHGIAEYRTVHRHLDDSIGANLNAEFESWLAGAKPTSVNLTQQVGWVDVWALGATEATAPLAHPVNVIEVEWIGGMA